MEADVLSDDFFNQINTKEVRTLLTEGESAVQRRDLCYAIKCFDKASCLSFENSLKFGAIISRLEDLMGELIEVSGLMSEEQRELYKKKIIDTLCVARSGYLTSNVLLVEIGKMQQEYGTNTPTE